MPLGPLHILLFQSLPAGSVLVLDPQFTFSTCSPWAGWARVSLRCDPCTEAPHFLPLLGPRPAGPSVCISPLGGLLGTWLVQPRHLPLPLPHVRVTSAPQQHRPNPQCHPSSLFHSHAGPRSADAGGVPSHTYPKPDPSSPPPALSPAPGHRRSHLGSSRQLGSRLPPLPPLVSSTQSPSTSMCVPRAPT